MPKDKKEKKSKRKDESKSREKKSSKKRLSSHESKRSVESGFSYMQDDLSESKMVDFDLIGQTFETNLKNDQSFSELNLTRESRGKGKIQALPAKSRKKDGKPPKTSLKLPIGGGTISSFDQRSVTGYKSARDRTSSAAPGSILKRSGSHCASERAHSQKKSVIFKDITDHDVNRDRSMANSSMNSQNSSPFPLSGILKNKVPRFAKDEESKSDIENLRSKKKRREDKRSAKKARKPELIRPITEASLEESARRQSPQGFDKVANFFKNMFTVCGTDGGCASNSRPKPNDAPRQPQIYEEGKWDDLQSRISYVRGKIDETKNKRNTTKEENKYSPPAEKVSKKSLRYTQGNKNCKADDSSDSDLNM
jgi:hypothetical protein